MASSSQESSPRSPPQGRGLYVFPMAVSLPQNQASHIVGTQKVFVELDKCWKQGTHNHESHSITAGYQMICKSTRFRNNFAVTTHMRSDSKPRSPGLRPLRSSNELGINCFLNCYLPSLHSISALVSNLKSQITGGKSSGGN